jgi:hypothetical protein
MSDESRPGVDGGHALFQRVVVGDNKQAACRRRTHHDQIPTGLEREADLRFPHSHGYEDNSLTPFKEKYLPRSILFFERCVSVESKTPEIFGPGVT